MFRKVLIFGNSGSGKSTLARRLSTEQNLVHLDLDTLAWKQGEAVIRAPLAESEKTIHNFMNGNTAWVIEGCYADLLTIALPFATDIIYLNLPIPICIKNAKMREWEPHKYQSKAAQDQNLNMLIEWISQYDERSDTFSKTAHLQLYNCFDGPKQMLTRNLCNR
ncbi:shikimate kinase [Alginatibacterium sediminis]|uniref:Shikimate kinase n=1 Tax=Alginatibacterium sediminis TaxID=2164068 RepID=A0A420E751_9ALTE|nr:AAA family ATPase [Alginatibacterium sediminis]RKF13748.1 shikimate kinase [Alginatibacterium sediminis]